MTAPIRTVLADEHSLFREAVRSILEKTGRIEVVAEVESGPAALGAIRTHAPDLVVTEMSLPRLTGAELVRRCRLDGDAATRFILLSARCTKSDVDEAIRAGAQGYVSKSDFPDELLVAIESVMKGLAHFSPRPSRHLIDIALAPPSGRLTLTSREREVLRLVADGLSSKEIAHHLAISPRTVECHRAHLMDKTGARNASGLIRYAIREGLISP